MSKFNVGDRVKVLKSDTLLSWQKAGEIGIVLETRSGYFPHIPYKVDVCNHPSWFKEDELELVSPHLPSFVWLYPSDHELKAEEIEGRIVLKEVEPKVYKSAGDFHLGCSLSLTWIKQPCLRYMLIDPAPEQEELKAFDGVMPLTDKYDDSKTYFVVWSKDELSITVRGATEAEARHNWNVWVEEHS